MCKVKHFLLHPSVTECGRARGRRGREEERQEKGMGQQKRIGETPRIDQKTISRQIQRKYLIGFENSYTALFHDAIALTNE